MLGAMPRHALLAEPPVTTQNPLQATDTFHRYCGNRFRSLSLSGAFAANLARLASTEALLPVVVRGDVRYYSTFQVLQLHFLEDNGSFTDTPSVRATQIQDELLPLLFDLQDQYLPETRSDQRIGELEDHGRTIAVGGTHFVTTTSVFLAALRGRRERRVREGRFSAPAVLQRHGMKPEGVVWWIEALMSEADHFDPLQRWHDLLKFVPRIMRDQLRYEALVAQDFYAVAHMLLMFGEDLGVIPEVREIYDWRECLTGPHAAALPHWKEANYGLDTWRHPYRMVELLANRYHLNPRPRAVIFTEGAEWQALGELYRHHGVAPELAGIELRSLAGEGNFKLANWQCFVEYMHEKQVLVYFVLDNEGHTAREAERLLGAKRRFEFEGLTKVVPTSNRIRVWQSCFEGANFTSWEIIRALKVQGVAFSASEVRRIRRDPARRRGLIEEIRAASGQAIDKAKLARDLVSGLIDLRRRRGRPVFKLRPVELFVRRTGRLIARNHLPSTETGRRRNFETGLLG